MRNNILNPQSLILGILLLLLSTSVWGWQQYECDIEYMLAMDECSAIAANYSLCDDTFLSSKNELDAQLAQGLINQAEYNVLLSQYIADADDCYYWEDENAWWQKYYCELDAQNDYDWCMDNVDP